MFLPSQQKVRRCFAIVVTFFALFLLSQIPYTMIRKERIRAFGEASASAVVLKKFREHSLSQYCLTYCYRGSDGLHRTRTAPFTKEAWKHAKVDSFIRIYYATGEPNISRAQGELENHFQVWLRHFARGNDLPEYRQ